MKNDLILGSVMIGTMQTKVLGEFYGKIFQREADWTDDGWFSWKIGGCQLTVGEHSKMVGESKDSGRIMFNFETEDVKNEFERMKELGAKEVQAPYEMSGMWIATLADPDNNYFQLMSPWKDEE